MRIYLFLLALIYCLFAQAAQIIAFERGDSIWMVNLDGSNARKITQGYLPEISPDGRYIAFNVTDSNNRYIAIVELASGKVTQFKNIPTHNNFSPAWSPDSKKLLFNAFVDNDWYLALINVDDSGYHLIKQTKGEFSPAWSPDGKSFFSHDLYSIYWMNFHGKIIKKWRLDTVIINSGMSSGSRIHVSPDGKKLIMDVDMNEDLSHKNWDAPPPAIWTLELDSGKTARLTPKGILAWSPFWISSDDFVFLAQEATEKKPVLYRSSIKKSPYLLILKDVQTPSISR